jgi:hypothetical protein
MVCVEATEIQSLSDSYQKWNYFDEPDIRIGA